MNSRLRTLLPLLREKLPFLALSVVDSVITLLAQTGAGSVSTLDDLPLELRVENALVAYGAYLGKLLWPGDMTVFYPYPKSFSVWEVAGAALLPVVVSGLVIRQGRQHRHLATGWFWFLGTLILVIGLLQVGTQARADRYTYLPYVGLGIMVAWGAPALLDSRRWHRAVLGLAWGIALAGCLINTRAQVQYWQNRTPLFEHTLNLTSDNPVAHYCLGMALLDQGKLDEAVAQFGEELRLKPASAGAHYGLGKILTRKGRIEEAVVQLQESVRLCPRAPAPCNELGKAYALRGELEKAMAMFQQTLKVKPDFGAAHQNLGRAYELKGRLWVSLAEFKKAARLTPRDATAQNKLAGALLRMGRGDEADRCFQAEARAKPGDPLPHLRAGKAYHEQ